MGRKRLKQGGKNRPSISHKFIPAALIGSLVLASILLIVFFGKKQVSKPQAPSGLDQIQGTAFTGEALGFNVFLEQDFEVEGGTVAGAVALGGDLTIDDNTGQFASQSAGTYTITGMSGPAGLITGGQVNLDGGGLNLLSGAKISIGSNTGTDAISMNNGANVNTRIVNSGNSYDTNPYINLNHHQSEDVYRTSPINFSDAFAVFRARSTNTAGISTNVTIKDANGNVLDPDHISQNSTIYINELSDGANILNLTGANLNKISGLTFNISPNADKYLFINVEKPGTFNWDNFDFAGIGSSAAPYILFNFFNSTTLNINSSSNIYGTIFAPNAAVEKASAGNIEGQIIASSFELEDGANVLNQVFLADDPNSGVFPVEWLHFSANMEAGKGVISWSTEWEINTSHFLVERRTPTASFRSIGQIEAAGNSGEHKHYIFLDDDLQFVEGKTVVYRIKQIDLDGNFSYSSSVEMELEGTSRADLEVFPNPARDKVSLSWDERFGPGRLRLLNPMGQVIRTIDLDRDRHKLELDLSAAERGVYIILMQGSTQTLSRTIILE